MGTIIVLCLLMIEQAKGKFLVTNSDEDFCPGRGHTASPVPVLGVARGVPTVPPIVDWIRP